MARSISIVEYKVAQTHFYLSCIKDAGLNFFAAQCYTDAFVSAARSITFSMQAVLSDISLFKQWYKQKQDRLKRDPLAIFFNSYRVASIHIGETLIQGGVGGKNSDGEIESKYYFGSIPEVEEVPIMDVLCACQTYFEMLLSIVFDAFEKFKYELDDRWYYTEEHFRELGKTIEDAEEELGFPRGWTKINKNEVTSDRWQILRYTQTVGCQINDLFDKYLNNTIKGPDEDN